MSRQTAKQSSQVWTDSALEGGGVSICLTWLFLSAETQKAFSKVCGYCGCHGSSLGGVDTDKAFSFSLMTGNTLRPASGPRMRKTTGLLPPSPSVCRCACSKFHFWVLLPFLQPDSSYPHAHPNANCDSPTVPRGVIFNTAPRKTALPKWLLI